MKEFDIEQEEDSCGQDAVFVVLRRQPWQ